MKAFLNNASVKKKYLARVRSHIKADEIIKGKYWQDGKGCAVGCTIHSSNHQAYELELGIPEWLARVEDIIFEGLPNERAKTWPEEFLDSIKVGVDLEQIKTPFLVFLLKNSIKSMRAVKYDKKKNPEVQRAIKQSIAAVQEMIRCHEECLDLSAAESAARSAELAARSAAWSAESAAWSAESARSASYEDYADELLRLIGEL
jgi:hypothetical protein